MSIRDDSGVDGEVKTIGVVRDALLGGVFSPGGRIDLAKLASAIRDRSKGSVKISAVVIRRALIELSKEGLVRIVPRSGTFLETISDHQLWQLWRTRVVLEDLFVSTIARMPRPDMADALDPARSFNNLLGALAPESASGEVPREVVEAATQYDILFHSEIANLAGYDLLVGELAKIRNVLRLASPKMQMTFGHLRQIVHDHSAILDAISLHQGAFVGDVVGARLALKSHLRNAADRHSFSTQLRANENYCLDPILDLPSRLGILNDNPHPLRAVALNVFRGLCEGVIASEIALQDVGSRLSVPQMVFRQMDSIARECEGLTSDQVEDKSKRMFVSLDIQFHVSLAFISGLDFLGDLIFFCWRRMYDNAVRDLGGARMAAVVKEHGAIVSYIVYNSFHGKPGENVAELLRIVKQHLWGAVGEQLKTEMTTHGLACDNIPPCVKEFVDWFYSTLSSESVTRR